MRKINHSIFLKQCKNKKQYKTINGAYFSLNKFKKSENYDGKEMNVYYCIFCNNWHIGHANKKGEL